MIYSVDGIFFSTKRKWAIEAQKDMKETSMYITKWKTVI